MVPFPHSINPVECRVLPFSFGLLAVAPPRPPRSQSLPPSPQEPRYPVGCDLQRCCWTSTNWLNSHRKRDLSINSMAHIHFTLHGRSVYWISSRLNRTYWEAWGCLWWSRLHSPHRTCSPPHSVPLVPACPCGWTCAGVVSSGGSSWEHALQCTQCGDLGNTGKMQVRLNYAEHWWAASPLEQHEQRRTGRSGAMKPFSDSWWGCCLVLQMRNRYSMLSVTLQH